MKINLDGTIIDVEMIYKPANRGIYFKYLGSNSFRVNSGYPYREKELEALFLKNKTRLLKLMQKLDSVKAPSNTIHYLGRELNVVVEENQRNECYIIGDTLYVKCKKISDRDKVIKAFYTDMVKEYTNRVFDSIFLKFVDLHIKRPTLKFKYTTTFYGKCFKADNTIIISGICMKMEAKYIDTVIHHELTHFKYLGHQQNFYRYFESKLPGARRLQHEFRMLRYKDIV